MAGSSGHGADKRIKGRKRHIAVDTEGTPAAVRVHPAGIQDRDGVPDVIPGMLAKAPEAAKLWAGSGYRGAKLCAGPAEPGVPDVLEIVERPRNIKGFTILCRRWAVERTFAWMPRCRRLAKDFERTLESPAAWAQLAARRLARRASD